MRSSVSGRSERSTVNSIAAVVGQAVNLLFGLFTRQQFIRVLGEEYLGINGVFYSVLSLLSIAELGLGSAMTYALYRPLAEGDNEHTGRIMNLYGRCYRIVAAVVTGVGLLLLPFLNLLIQTDSLTRMNLTVIYGLFLSNSALSYLFSYRRTLVTAAEYDWRSSLNTAFFGVVQNILQLIILLIWQNYIGYLLIQLFCTVLSNLEIYHTAGKMFPYLSKVKEIPEKEECRQIAGNVKSMFFMRFGSIAVTGTDNLLIASVDVVLAGLYSNYLLILQTVQNVLGQAVTAVTASVGNMMTEQDDTKKRTVYRNLIFVTAWMYGFCAIALDILMGRFIALFFGDGLSIPTGAVHLMCLNFYLAGLRQPNIMYINAAGLFYHVRFRGFAEAGVNLGVSALFLSMKMGLFGVLLGTTVSHLLTGILWETICVSRHCLSKKAGTDYFLMNFGCICVTILSFLAVLCVTDRWEENFIGFILSGMTVVILPNLCYFAVYSHTPPFAFFKSLLLRIGKKIWKKIPSKPS